jgi:tripartite-type tricarboxylate transporter receptor subunit TctC
MVSTLCRRARVRRGLCLTGAASIASAALVRPSTGFAHAYPARSIRLVVPFPPGGAVDLLGRAIGQALAEQLAVPVVIDNRPGASGVIGTQAVVQAPADGYTVLLCYDGTLTINPVVSKVPFDTLRDLAPVTRLVNSPMIFAVGAAVPARDFDDLKRFAQHSALTYATSGAASTPHMFGELVKLQTGLNWTHVPYKGAGQAIADVLGGSVTGVLTTVSTVDKYLRAGQMRGLFVSGAERSKAAPAVPTVVELGFTAATPVAIVDRLHREIGLALGKPELRERLLGLGFDPVGSTPTQFRTDIDADLRRWAQVAARAGIRLD